MRALVHARLHWRRGELDAAEFRLEQAVADRPDSADRHAELALLRVAQERPAAAEAALREAFALEPDSAYARYVRSYLRLAPVRRLRIPFVGDRLLDVPAVRKALEDVREAVALEPDEPLHRVRLAEVLGILGEWPASLAAADEALVLDPQGIRCLAARGAALSALGRPGDAQDVFLVALSLEPESPELHAQLGWVLLDLEDDAGATNSFREALRLDPASDEAAAGALLCAKREWGPYRAVSVLQRRLGRAPTWIRLAVPAGVVVAMVAGVLVADGPGKGNTVAEALAVILILAFLFLGVASAAWEPFHDWRVRRHAASRTPHAEGDRLVRRRIAALVAGTLAVAAIAALLGTWDRRIFVAFVGAVPGAAAFGMGGRLDDPRLRRWALSYGAVAVFLGAMAALVLERRGWIPTGMAFGLAMGLPILPVAILRERDRRSLREARRESVRRTLK